MSCELPIMVFARGTCSTGEAVIFLYTMPVLAREEKLVAVTVSDVSTFRSNVMPLLKFIT